MVHPMCHLTSEVLTPHIMSLVYFLIFLTFCFLTSSLSNMHIDTTVDAAIQTADLVVEAVVENMELKQKLFAEYDDKVV